MKKIKCKEFSKFISKNNIEKHYRSKSCLEGKTHNKILPSCLYCGISLENINSGNHIRWCNKNPNRNKNIGRKSWNSGLTKDTNNSLKEISKKIKDLHNKGLYQHIDRSHSFKGKKHTEETKIKISNSSRESKHTRRCKKTHEYIDKKGRSFLFDSSWEDALANRLDQLNIKWIRPDPIQYWIKDKSHNYFPDFYLEDYNIYLDPKNTWCIKQQSQKIKIISSMINLIILDSIEKCNNFMVDLPGLEPGI